MIKKILPIVFLLFTLSFSAKNMAQNGTLIYNMKNLPQSNALNPSTMPNAKVYITLPSFVFTANAPFSYASLWTNEPDGTKIFDGSSFLKGLDPNNRLNLSPDIHVLGFGVRANDKLLINFSVSARSSFNVDFNKDLFTLLVDGNMSSINKGPMVLVDKNFAQATAWGEVAVGGAYKLNDQWTLGAKVKLLSGVANLTTNNTLFTFETQGDAERGSAELLRIQYDLDIRTSGLDFDSLNFDDAEFPGYSTLQNLGFAFDLGATYKMNEKFEFSASVVDLGFINWDKSTKNIRNANGTGEFTLIGFNWDDVVVDGSWNSEFVGKLTDTLKALVEYETVDGESYTQMIPTRFYLGGSYNIFSSLKASVLYRGEFVRNNYYSTTALSLTYTPFRYLELSVGNSIVGNDWFCPGFGVSLGPVYFVANYISDIYLTEMKNFNIQFGFNIALGNPDKKKE